MDCFIKNTIIELMNYIGSLSIKSKYLTTNLNAHIQKYYFVNL